VVEYRNFLRLSAAKEMLKNTNAPVTQIAFSLGYNDRQLFQPYFQEKTGVTPLAYRKNVPEEHNFIVFGGSLVMVEQPEKR